MVEVLPGSLGNAVYAGDTITSVDGTCAVRDAAGWLSCLAGVQAAFAAGRTGMCVPQASSIALPGWQTVPAAETRLVRARPFP